MDYLFSSSSKARGNKCREDTSSWSPYYKCPQKYSSASLTTENICDPRAFKCALEPPLSPFIIHNNTLTLLLLLSRSTLHFPRPRSCPINLNDLHSSSSWTMSRVMVHEVLIIWRSWRSRKDLPSFRRGCFRSWIRRFVRLFQGCRYHPKVLFWDAGEIWCGWHGVLLIGESLLWDILMGVSGYLEVKLREFIRRPQAEGVTHQIITFRGNERKMGNKMYEKRWRSTGPSEFFHRSKIAGSFFLVIISCGAIML